MAAISVVVVVVSLVLLTGLLVFSVWRKHVLMSLLSLEYMVLGVFAMFFYSYLGYGAIMLMGYLVMTACEGALGLAVLVSMTRSHGGDYFSGFHLM